MWSYEVHIKWRLFGSAAPSGWPWHLKYRRVPCDFENKCLKIIWGWGLDLGFTTKSGSIRLLRHVGKYRSATQIYTTEDKTLVRTSNPDCKFICDWNGDCCPEKQPRPIHKKIQKRYSMAKDGNSKLPWGEGVRGREKCFLRGEKQKETYLLLKCTKT